MLMAKVLDKKGFHTTRVYDDEYDDNMRAADSCPVNIIQVKKI